jgi:hypothetical protein
MFTECSLNVHYMFTDCSQVVADLAFVSEEVSCAMYTMFTKYSLNVH